MRLEPDTIVRILLRERLRVIAVATFVVRDGHAADDIFQEVVLAALKAPENFRDASHVLAWALRTARHRALDVARKRHLWPLSSEVLDLVEAELPDADLRERVAALHHCLEKLAPKARRLLRLRYDEGLSCGRIAKQLHRTIGAVYQTLCRVHRALRTCLDSELPPRPGLSRSEAST